MSSTILTVIVLVVMWLVVLVPMFVRRGDEPDETGVDGGDVRVDAGDDGVDGFDDGDADSGVDGAVTTPEWTAARPPARHPLAAREVRDTVEGESPARSTRDSGAPDGPGHPSHPAPSARARMLARRRRALAVLIGLTLLTFLIVLFSRGRPGAWLVQVGCDLLLTGYLVGLRREVRQERMRRAVRLARAAAARAEARTRRTVRAARISRTARTSRATGTARPNRRTSPRVNPHLDPESDDPVQRRRVV